MVPKLSAVQVLVQESHPDPVLVGLLVLGHDVHGDLAQVQVRTDAAGRRDPRGRVDLADQFFCQHEGRGVISIEIGCQIDEDFVHRVYVDILRRDVLQIDVVDPGTVFHVQGHAGHRGDIGDLLLALLFACSIDLAHTLHDLEQPGSATDPQGF